jgi:hypothetical protein
MEWRRGAEVGQRVWNASWSVGRRNGLLILSVKGSMRDWLLYSWRGAGGVGGGVVEPHSSSPFVINWFQIFFSFLGCLGKKDRVRRRKNLSGSIKINENFCMNTLWDSGVSSRWYIMTIKIEDSHNCLTPYIFRKIMKPSGITLDSILYLYGVLSMTLDYLVSDTKTGNTCHHSL